ncbi:hypothetical protein JMY81_01085 [Brenneria goodwinii]|uniref:Phage-related protein n=1 Tax=Brenneria goodwinii TaxID=1109412 RepID=A0A0G4K157_9GAMM|nr:hypothetical protein [Brenneria goodwinii]MCG8155189.1 hypothetical protein [Brenneria goodwinii]MCG8159433.1 hypothetical protein [Brenneria goodwinii]MCG8164398.1 hypothetical protein [Brenneria goodwinii]MCG8169036.1 hypothetical protein [Brenneria goodwinii]MCG8173292.1 hypothetical protein [Brenneria goodwinii]
MKLNAKVRGSNKIALKLKQIQDRVMAKRRVSVGLPAGSGNYEDGAPIAVIGAVQEFGTADGRVPERSFLRVPIRQNCDDIKKAFRALTGAVTRGEITAFQMLDQIGSRAAGYCQEAIEMGIQPANADSTIKQKGSATPIINHGIFKGKITHVVED